MNTAPPESKITVDNTPIERHRVAGRDIWVKREDLSSPLPGPQFAKIRGVEARLKRLKAQTIGTLDTYHSKAGWGVSFACSRLGRQSVVFYPEYKGEPGPRDPQIHAASLGGELIPIPAGRSCILYHRAKKILSAEYPGAVLMPNGLKLPESVDATMKELLYSPPDLLNPPKGRNTWVVSVSSGTMAAGVVRGLVWLGLPATVVLHMGYSRSRTGLESYLQKMVGGPISPEINIEIVDEGFGYKDAAPGEAPFPCNEYYDLKAWNWLGRNALRLEGEVVFWNIGE